MEIGVQCQRLCNAQIQRLLLILGILAATLILFQLFALPYGKYLPSLSHANKGSVSVMVGSATLLNSSKLSNIADIDKERNSRNEYRLGMGLILYNSSTIRIGRGTDNSSTQEKVTGLGLGALEQVKESDNNFTLAKDQNTISSPVLGGIHSRASFEGPVMSPRIFTNGMEHLDADSRPSLLPVAANVSPRHTDKQTTETQSKDASTELMQKNSVTESNNSSLTINAIKKERGMKTISISQMNLLLLQSFVSSNSMRPRWSSARDRQLQYARLQIENAPTVRNTPGLDASLFRNFSMFKRSYEMMERMLKVYIYREGEKPIFHQPYLRGIYASEGWFMKLIEGNKQFVVRDPTKAHLFYLPFSSKKLRNALDEQKLASKKDLEKYLDHYVDMIAGKYRFWNRTGGADHFSVACHDWAPRMTRKNMGSCIRALCNTNMASGFKIGKDVSLPVTYVRTAQDPLKGIGGKPPSGRPILAFFAGGMHGYLRPILLQYWKDKEPDMKIFGPMPRDIEGKAMYRDHMKSSKYCICARGYEVHTPRVVESIFYECVPVIIADNYVPPFFEILDWEAFSVFVPEKDIPNLRNILLSIPEEKYLAMQQRVKMVQQHFFWHKQPVKYDLFHMILHSVWYNRVFQLKTR